MNMWTTQDLLDGKCNMDQVGSPKPLAQSTVPTAPPQDSKALVQEFMEVYNEMGGRQALLTQAKANPMKFYDQLLKILVAMEAPQQVMAVQMNFGPLSDEALDRLPTIELKRRLLLDMGPAYEGTGYLDQEET